MSGGYAGRVLYVDLTSGIVDERVLPEETYRGFLGGSGLGVRMLYEHMKPNADPLGPDNIFGFAPGLLTGTIRCGGNGLGFYSGGSTQGRPQDSNVAASVHHAGWHIAQHVSPTGTYVKDALSGTFSRQNA